MADHRPDAYALLLGACPLLALATDAGRAAGFALALPVAAALCVLLYASLRVAARGDPGRPAFALIVATALGVAELVLAAWQQPLYRPIAAALPLVVANAAWLRTCRDASALAALRAVVPLALLVLVVGVLRDAPLGGVATVLATPAGAFILLALLLALRQSFAHRPEHVPA